ncbi:MAG: 2-5 ligase [Anaerocolumna sp.]|nr:2-5 ligase [Anaerocolumna sp.]
MSEQFLCVMAGFDDQTEKHLEELQKELYQREFVGIHTKNIPLHITLGIFDVSEEKMISTLVKMVSSNTESFDVTFNHIGIFGGSEVLFIAPDINRELLKLKENFGESYDWTPHVTMLIDEPAEIFKAAQVLSSSFTKFKGRVEKLYLYEFWPSRYILAESMLNR